MFTVKLWSFSKPVNSTAIPSAAASEYNCAANDRLSVVAPVIKLAVPITTDMSVYNYARIDNFHRYYWITDWTFDQGLWYASMNADVLASYKTEIGGLSPYILRSSHTYDGTIMDNFYPAKTVYSETTVTAATPWEYGGVTDGCYSVGIISEGGVTTFWLMSKATLDSLMQYLLSEDYANDVLTELLIDAYPEAKAIVEPLQYIASITWLPITLPVTALTNVKIGYAEKVLDVNTVYPALPAEYTFTFNRPAHPQAAARGVYMNASPYTRYSIFFPPFGKVDIDPALVLAQTAITVKIYLDKCQGNGTMEIKAGDYVLSRTNAKIGMPVQISQVIAPGYGIVTAAGTAAGIAGDILSGNFGAAASRFANGIGDAIKSQIPSVNSVGSVGSCDALIGMPALQASFASTVNDDLSSRGRPLCQVKQISTIPGYIMCADVEINIGCTEAEHVSIKAFMEGGFFYA